MALLSNTAVDLLMGFLAGFFALLMAFHFYGSWMASNDPFNYLAKKDWTCSYYESILILPTASEKPYVKMKCLEYTKDDSGL